MADFTLIVARTGFLANLKPLLLNATLPETTVATEGEAIALAREVFGRGTGTLIVLADTIDAYPIYEYDATGEIPTIVGWEVEAMGTELDEDYEYDEVTNL